MSESKSNRPWSAPLETAGSENHDAPQFITTVDQLPARLCPQPGKLMPAARAFPLRISGHMLSLLHRPGDPLARQFIPDPAELDDPRSDVDPLSEENQSPAVQIIHRYPGRVILLVSTQCALHCRYCMRKRKVRYDRQVSPQAIEMGLEYIRRTPLIKEVILSGGDPLMLTDDRLADILTALKHISHVRVLRLHTRIPGVWPQRVTPAMANMLARFQPLFINIQFNHPDEIVPEVAQACSLLADAGLPLGSQTVLLKGINDDAAVLGELMEQLMTIRVRPYYLHQIDRVAGTAHFQVAIEKGLMIMDTLRGQISGMAIPHFMIDLPGGGGKMELLPDAIVQKSLHQWMIRNFEGRIVPYPVSDCGF